MAAPTKKTTTNSRSKGAVARAEIVAATTPVKERPKTIEEKIQIEERRLKGLTAAQRDLANDYASQDKVAVNIAPLYEPYFGRVMPVVLNGIPIYVPVDGKVYYVPKSYAMEVNARIRKVNDQQKRAKRMSNVKSNHERYIGERDLIQPAR